jgi:hypothetical protein
MNPTIVKTRKLSVQSLEQKADTQNSLDASFTLISEAPTLNGGRLSIENELTRMKFFT